MMSKGFFDHLLLYVYTMGVIFLLMTSLAGCQTAGGQKRQVGTGREARQAIVSITAAASGRALTEEDLHHLERQIKTDPQAKTAVENVTDALSGRQVNIKYCPVDGKRYAARLKVCPEHDVELKFLEE